MEAIQTEKITKKINANAIIGVLIFSALIATFNETILNVALVNVSEMMNVSIGTVQWLITAYMIVTSVMVPVTAFLIQTFKIKQLFLGALTLLLIGTIGGAVTGTFYILVISRMIQAAGTGMMIPIMMNVVLIVSPKEKLGLSMALCVCAISLGPAFGPIVSGLVLQYYTYHALFILMIPIIIIAMIIGYFILIDISEVTKPKIDFISIILSTIGLASLIYAINNVSSGDIKITAITFVLGIVILTLFVRRQLNLEQPMLDLAPFRYSKFSLGVLLVMVSMMVMFTMNVLLPTYLQGSLNTSTFISAIALFPAVICNAVSASISGKLYDKFGIKFIAPFGLALISIFVFALSRCTSETSLMTVVVLYAGVGIGVGFTMSPCQTHALKQLPKEYYPHGVAIVNTLQQVSAAVGSSLFMGIMASVEVKMLLLENVTSEYAISAGFSSATLAAFVIGVIGLIISLVFVRNKNS